MKISFWSSTEYSGFLAGLMRELNEAGAHAEQCFQISERSYRSAKSTPARLFLRFRQYVIYPLLLCIKLSGRAVRVFSLKFKSELQTSENDVCVVSTNTFYAPLLATFLHPNVVHLVYDLFPEAMIHSGKWREGTLKVKVVRWITKQTLRRAKQNVFLGQRLKDYVESIHGAVPNSVIIAVGADQALFSASPKQRVESGELRVESGSEGDLPEEFGHALSHSTLKVHSGSTRQPRSVPTVLYCGNFGNMHDSATLFQFWNRSATLQRASHDESSDWDGLQRGTLAEASRYVFHCSGPKRAELESTVRALPSALRAQITLGDGLSQSEWIAAMESADVALVTMTPGSETVVMPSKTYSAMMAGQAILAIAPEDSDLVDLIKVADCGWWVNPGDVEGLSKVVGQICADPTDVMEKRERAFHYAHQHLGQDALAKQWMKTLREITR